MFYGAKFFVIIYISMYSSWFRGTFLRVSKFLQIKEWIPKFWGEPILQNLWIFWSLLLYFNFKSLMEAKSSSLIRFQCILHDSGVPFSESWNFYKLKRGDIISGGNQFCRMSELFGRPLLYFNFKSFLDPNSSPCITFQWILYDSGVDLSGFSNFYKLKRGDLISWGNQFCRMSELFGPPFCISILKVLWTQILRFSLDFRPFCMNQEDFSQSPEISTN